MKKTYLFLLICLLAHGVADAQLRRAMSHVTPRITNNFPWGVKMLSAAVWTVGDGEKINVTFNAGGVWTTVKGMPNRSIIDYYCVSNGEYFPMVYAATDTGIFYTENMGETWNQTTVMGQKIFTLFPAGDRLYYVSRPYSSTEDNVKWLGYLTHPSSNYAYELPVGYSFQLLQVTTNIIYLYLKKGSSVDLLRSTSGGSSWTTITGVTNPISFPLVSGFAFGKHVFLVLGSAGRLRSTVVYSADSGRTYQVYAPLAADTMIGAVTFSQARGEGILFGSDYTHMQLARYNIITSSFEFEERSNSIDIMQGDRYEQTAICLGTNSEILKADLSANPLPLTDLNTFLNSPLRGIKVLSSGKPVFLQRDGAIGRYDQDGNYTATAPPYPASQAAGFAVPDDSTYYVIGSNQYFYRSTDGGKSFQASRISGAQDLRAIYFFNAMEGLVSDAQGSLWKTTTGGDRWFTAPSPGGSVWGFYFYSYDIGFAFGTSLYRTTNHGQSWQAVATVSSPTYDGFFSVDFERLGQYGLAASGYEVFKTTNFGTSWTKLNNINALFGKCFVKDANTYEVFSRSLGTYNYATTNGGTTWTSRMMTRTNFEYYDGDSPENFWGTTFFTTMKSDNSYNIAGLGTAKGATGDTVIVSVYSDLNRYKKYNSLEFKLLVDTSKVSFIGFDEDASRSYKAAAWTKVHNFTQPGKLSVAAYGADSINGFGDILGLKFRIKPSNDPIIPLRFESFTYNSGADSTYTPYFQRIVKDTTLYGDVDINSVVQAYDAALVLRRIAGIIPEFSAKANRQADVTRDNTLSALDASAIAQYVVGLIPRLPIPPAYAKGSVSITPFISQAGAKISVPVRIIEARNIYSFEGALRYDPAVLTLEGVSWGGQFSQFLKEGKMETGCYRFACAGTAPVAAAMADIITLTFTVKNAVLDANTTVMLNGFRLNENPALTEGNTAIVALPTGIAEGNNTPAVFSLHRNYPNPFNPSTVITYDVAEASVVSITVFDVLGNEVAVLLNERKEAGSYQAVFDATRAGRQLQAGIYFVRMNAGKFTQTQKMMLLK